MRYLRRQTLNRRAAYDNTLYVDTNRAVVMGSRVSLTLPTGDETEYPAIYENGMIRYNSGTYDAVTNPNGGQVEVYQGNTWRALRFKESGAITQQTLGIGDGDTIFFGPLSPEPPSISQSDYSWTGANLLVIVENVIQLHTTNYLVEQNPTLSAETYNGELSESANTGATELYFNGSVEIVSASGTGSTATLLFVPTSSGHPIFNIGQTIIVTGLVPYEYNGEFEVTASTANSVSYVSTATGSLTVRGLATSNSTMYYSGSIPLTGATISGGTIPPGTTVTGFDFDVNTGSINTIGLSAPLTGLMPAGTSIIINRTSQPAAGYYLRFSSPIPPGKPVTVLHGFDQ